VFYKVKTKEEIADEYTAKRWPHLEPDALPRVADKRSYLDGWTDGQKNLVEEMQQHLMLRSDVTPHAQSVVMKILKRLAGI
jgi:hypothetical protein